MSDTQERPLRLLLSRKTCDRIGAAIAEVLGNRRFEAVIASPLPGEEPRDVDIAFISRDVTGVSTKHVIAESLEAFYTSLRATAGLRWVHAHSAGADRPIIAELRARGVTVTLSSGANAPIVAQTALAGILALAREFPRLFDAQRERRWAPLVGAALPADLAGQTAIVVGWGPIGRRIAELLRVLGVLVIVARSTEDPAAADIETVRFEALQTVAGRAHWLVLACPLSDRTRRLVDARLLAGLRPGARLVNVARGEVVVEQDLIDALRSGVLSGAYLDVFEHEPLDPLSPLWGQENVIVTPHSAGHSDGNEARVDRIFLEHLREWRNEPTLPQEPPWR